MSPVSTRFIRTSICDKYSGSIEITYNLDRISRFLKNLAKKWSHRWTYQVLIINTRSDEIGETKSNWQSQGGTSGRGWQTILMLTLLVFGTNPSTFEEERARSLWIGEAQ